MVVIDKYTGDYEHEGELLIKKGKWLQKTIPRMWTDGFDLFLIDVDTRKVLRLSSCACGVGQAYGFRLEYHNKDEMHSNDIGTFFYCPDEDKWIFTNW